MSKIVPTQRYILGYKDIGYTKDIIVSDIEVRPPSSTPDSSAQFPGNICSSNTVIVGTVVVRIRNNIGQ